MPPSRSAAPGPMPVRMLRRLAFSAAVAAAAHPATAAPHLVRDLNTSTVGGSDASHFATLGDRVVFVADDGVHGRELWTTDGSAAPSLVVDGCPGACSGVEDPVVAGVGPLLFFSRGPVLYRSDGTATGTFAIADARPYLQSEYHYWSYLPVSGRWIFRALSEGYVRRLWVTDGTRKGTHPLDDVPVPEFPDFEVVGDRLFLVAPGDGIELWVTDGTAAGTRALKTGSLISSHLAAVGDKLVFVRQELTGERELWRSDGTVAGTEPFFTPPTALPFFADDLVGDGGLGFFTALVGPLQAGRQLWRTDGTAAGTFPVTSFPIGFNADPESCGFSPAGYSVGINRLEGGVLYRALDDGISGCEPWRSDGSVAGTWPLGDLCPGSCGSFPFELGGPVKLGAGVLFTAGDDHGREWWTGGASPGVATLIADLCPGSCDGAGNVEGRTADRLFLSGSDGEYGLFSLLKAGGEIRLLTDRIPRGHGFGGGGAASVGDRFVFRWVDPLAGLEPWRSDGTPEGTRPLANLAPDRTEGSYPRELAEVGDRLFFIAVGDEGVRPYASTGTAAGTVPLRSTNFGGDVRPGVARVGEDVVYALDGGIWHTDGTPRGTRRLADYSPLFTGLGSTAAVASRFYWIDRGSIWVGDVSEGGHRRYSPRGIEVFLPTGPKGPGALGAFSDGRLLFYGQGTAGSGVWVTDGTAAGTFLLVADAIPATGFAELDGRLIFGLDTPFASAALWVSDGTPEGTRRLEPASETNVTDVDFVTSLHGALYFSARDGFFVPRLYRSDGTPDGTHALRSFEGGLPVAAAAAGDLFFVVTVSEGGSTLWRSDGTSEGTFVVLPHFLWEGGSPAFGVGNRFYFFEQDSVEPFTGPTLWSSDGTAGGTQPIHGIVYPSNPWGGNPWPAPAGPLVVFAVTAATGETELWTADSRNGEIRRGPVVPGTSGPLIDITAAGRFVYFAAATETTGDELWAVSLDDLEPQVLHLGRGARFEASVEWEDYAGQVGRGTAAPLRVDDSGLFWFFGDDNWELLVKVLDACAIDGHHWVFANAATSVGFTLQLRDTATGTVRRYANPVGRQASPIVDTTSFADCANDSAASAGAASAAPDASERAASPQADDGCPAGVLCLRGGRFHATLDWRAGDGRRGGGAPVVGSDESGLFWFFDEENWEALVKVLDGCAITGKHWVFAAATTTLELTLRVEDTLTGEVAEYRNPLGRPASAIVDTGALGGCP